MKKQKCLRCGHIWYNRVKKPAMCPACKSRYWDEKREEK